MSELSLRELRDQVLNKKSPSKKPTLSDVPTPKIEYNKPSVNKKDALGKNNKNKKVELGKADQCFIIIPDVHSYYRDVGAYELTMEAVKVISDKYNVTKIVQLGDLMECGEISGHPPTHVNESIPSYIDEIDWAVNDFWKRLKDNSPKAKLFGLLGNHEHRINAWLIRNIGKGRMAESMYEELDPTSLYTSLGVNVTPYGEEDPRVGTLEIFPKLTCLHGWSFAENAAAVHLNYVGLETSVLFGHVHRIQMHSRRRAISNELVAAWTPGCLSRNNLNYMRGKPSAHANGFAVVFTHENSFTVNTLPILGDKHKHVLLPDGTYLKA